MLGRSALPGINICPFIPMQHLSLCSYATFVSVLLCNICPPSKNCSCPQYNLPLVHNSLDAPSHDIPIGNNKLVTRKLTAPSPQESYSPYYSTLVIPPNQNPNCLQYYIFFTTFTGFCGHEFFARRFGRQ